MSVNKKEFENNEVTEPFISFKSNDKKENIKFVYDIYNKFEYVANVKIPVNLFEFL